MENCLNCGNSATYSFQVLEVQTLHVRDLKGESRVQALGECREFSICQACAAAALEAVRHPAQRLVKPRIAFGGIFLLGLALCLLFWSTQGALRLMGLAALVCGGFGLYSTQQSAKKQQQAYASLSEEAALQQAAWETLLRAAPQKVDDADLTYLPINEQTLAMKNGDLMVAFSLLPAVAAKAHTLLHSGEQAQRETP